ncbi:permease [Desulfohalovibrio reitneri]|uniref:permease n=1 Tax=Desulfohalovibrio reitneri TaxID=1307759 RepID=UPI0004A73D71|nr:permease [Desulfohalovibrio reitneri]
MEEQAAIFATIATAIVLEASPFLLLGSLFAAVFELYAEPEALARRLPSSRPGQLLAGLFGGLLLPTCECGTVPLTRRLLAKGVSPRTALAFMLAAPVANPVVLAGTYVAFRGEWSMVLGRLAMVLVPAAALAWAAGEVPVRKLLRARLDASPHGDGCACGCGHEHHHGPAPRGLRAIPRLLALAGQEFLHMAGFLILGALAAAAVKTFLPQDLLFGLASSPVLAIAAMMLLAVLLSVCSEADAFVAAGFASFPMQAQVAFTAIGPMVDLKLLPLYFGVFARPLAVALVVVPAVSVFFLSLAWVWLGGGL